MDAQASGSMTTNGIAMEPAIRPVGTENAEHRHSGTATKEDTPSASASASPLATSELGCRLGSFWDVAHSIGIQVTSLTLEPLGESDHSTTQSAPDSVTQPSSRRLAKFSALVSAFTDSMFHAGYIVRNIDAKLCDLNARGPSKLWNMEVCFATSEQSNR